MVNQKKIKQLATGLLFSMTAFSFSFSGFSYATTSDEWDAKLDELYQQEEAIFNEHADLWEIIFNSEEMNEEKMELNDSDISSLDDDDIISGADDSRKYYLDAIEAQKDQLTDEEIKELKDDVEKLYKIEQQMDDLFKDMSDAVAAEDETDHTDIAVEEPAMFPDFEAVDFDGSTVDQSVFADNAVTVVNFWFNGCPPCVDELPVLSELNAELAKRSGAVIGINSDVSYNEEMLTEAIDILNVQEADYMNLAFDMNSDAGAFLAELQYYPTTYLVDRHGVIIGEPIVGSIKQANAMEELRKRIDDIINADQADATGDEDDEDDEDY